MLIAKNERKNLNTQKKTSGCWFRSKRLWPKAVLYSVEMSNNAHRYENSMAERCLPLATPLANYYAGEFSQRIEALAKALFTDIYHGPESAFDMVLRNPECAREYGSDLFEAMRLIGGYNIFFDNGRIEDEIISASEEIASGLYLARSRIGMPVKYFLLYYRGEGMRRKQIASLSGIPAEYVQWAYNIVTTYMWEMLDGIHQRKRQEKCAQRKMPVRQPAEEIKLLVDFSKPRPKTEEPTTEESMDTSVEELQALMDKVLGEIDTEPQKAPTMFDQVPFNPEGTEETSE